MPWVVRHSVDSAFPPYINCKLCLLSKKDGLRNREKVSCNKQTNKQKNPAHHRHSFIVVKIGFQYKIKLSTPVKFVTLQLDLVLLYFCEFDRFWATQSFVLMLTATRASKPFLYLTWTRRIIFNNTTSSLSINLLLFDTFFQTVQKFGGDYAKSISEENYESLAFLTCFVQLNESLAPANFPPFHKITSFRSHWNDHIILSIWRNSYSIRPCWARCYLSPRIQRGLME